MMGCAVYVIRTSMAERLLELASREGLSLASAKRTGEREITISVRPEDEKKLLRLLETLHIPYDVLKKSAKERAAEAAKKHIALLPMLLAALALLAFLSSRVWFIEISDPNADGIALALKEAGIRPGTGKSAFSPAGLSRELGAAFPEYAYIGVKLSGVYLYIDPVEELKAPDVYRREEIRNLYADSDGVIERIHVFAGTAMVQAGDTVKKGEILILGEERASPDGETVPVRAEGSVTARTWTKAEASAALYLEEKQFTGRESEKRVLRCPFFTVVLNGQTPFGLTDAYETTMPVGGLFLPLEVANTRYREYTVAKTPIGQEEAGQAAGAKALAKARSMARANDREAKHWIQLSAPGGTNVRAAAVVEWIREIADEKQGG